MFIRKIHLVNNFNGQTDCLLHIIYIVKILNRNDRYVLDVVMSRRTTMLHNKIKEHMCDFS